MTIILFAVGAAGAARSEIWPENLPKLRKCKPKWTSTAEQVDFIL
jgi:hypothetical protein